MRSRGDGLGYLREFMTRVRFERIESELVALRKLRRDVASEAHQRLERGQPVTRAQAAAFLGVSTKKLQRMEAAGNLRRCPGMGGLVLYSARDVLRLASAR